MKETRVVESWSQYNLPVELLLEILLRLPVKSLLQFRCVSKLWLSLIANHNFCQLHLNNFNNNLHETHLLFVEGSLFDQKKVCVARCNTFQVTERLDTMQFTDKWCMVYSVDGLVMLQDLTSLPMPTVRWDDSFRRDWIVQSKLMLWNPSIRTARVLPTYPESSKEKTEIDYVNLGFGFSHLIQDYKHVRLMIDGESNLHSIAIYTVGTSLWKTTHFKGKGCSNWHWFFDFSFEWKTVYFKGALYFIPRNLNSYAQDELVSFDLSSEVFAATSLPLEGNAGYLGIEFQALMLVDGGRSLGVLNVVPSQGSIWVLENSVYWIKRCAFSLTIPDLPDELKFSESFHWCRLKLLHVKKNCDMLLQWLLGEVTLLNLETQEEKFILENGDGSEPESSNLHRVCGYVESLVLLNG